MLPASELVWVQLLKSVCLPVNLYALHLRQSHQLEPLLICSSLDNLIIFAIYRMFNCTSQYSFMYNRSMCELSHLRDVVQIILSPGDILSLVWTRLKDYRSMCELSHLRDVVQIILSPGDILSLVWTRLKDYPRSIDID